jgi:hypothetical protein
MRVFLAIGMAVGASLALPVTAQEGRIELRVRDSRTGARVAARTAFRQDGGQRQLLRVEADGYQALETALAPDPALPVTVWLDPVAPAAALEAEATRAGNARIEGRVFDARTGSALAGARVVLSGSKAESATGADGAFALELSAPATDALALPAMDDLLVKAEGYRTQIRRAVFLVEGTTRLVIDLEPGAGAVEEGQRHKMLRSPEELRRSQGEAPPAGVAPGSSALGPRPAVPVPDSIRVGTGCTCATCSAVQVFSLDTYTRLGLDDEWIASWRADSLRAGAIAYRSYGAYHVAHPRSPNFDICNTTCCQVLDPADSHANTDAATAFTSNMIVVNASRSEPFFAEYAAENNGSFCPDGQTGRPDGGWPCLADAVDAGTAFNGHGRGMCQWGTQRWAANQGRNYAWIVNHYYNDNGSPAGSRSGVLQMPGSAFFALTPCRAVDTRAGGTPLAANSRRTLAVSGLCQVPAEARAVAAILTAVNPGDSGDLRVYPAGQPPPAVSAINFARGLTRANNTIIPLGTGGQIDVQCDMPPGSTGSTHLVLDVLGYFR